MIIAFEASAGAVVIKRNLRDGRTGDHETDVSKRFRRVIAAGSDIGIAEIGAGLVAEPFVVFIVPVPLFKNLRRSAVLKVPYSELPEYKATLLYASPADHQNPKYETG